MSSSGKRLDLRFGAFACSVQGFDDPVQPVQQVLRAIQHLLEESPELSDTAINFDAESIEQLVGEVARRAELDEDSVEIVPGLVIVHHAGGGDLAGGGAADERAHGAADYVNIFGSSGGEYAADVEAGDEPETVAPEGDAPVEAVAARLRRGSDDAPADAEYGWDDTGDDIGDAAAGSHFLSPAAPREQVEWGDDTRDDEIRPDDAAEEEPVNLFAGVAEDNNKPAGGEVTNLFAPNSADESGDDEDDDAMVLGQPSATRSEDAEGEGYTAAGLAERAGARSVPELMVSAAAFMVLVRGQGQFTRRDVLDVFQTIPGDHEKTLEAQIKGFGKAVRNGQLVMIEDGVFGLSRDELDRFQQLL